MSVTINDPLSKPKGKPIPGRPSYNEAIKKLVPAIKEAREKGHYGVREMADYLNSKGISAPSGRPFSYTTLHDILERLWELGVTEGTRPISEAASKRRYRFRRGRSTSGPALTALRREQPELLKGLRMPGSSLPSKDACQ
jgi:hypothetical protein